MFDVFIVLVSIIEILLQNVMDVKNTGMCVRVVCVCASLCVCCVCV